MIERLYRLDYNIRFVNGGDAPNHHSFLIAGTFAEAEQKLRRYQVEADMGPPRTFDIRAITRPPWPTGAGQPLAGAIIYEDNWSYFSGPDPKAICAEFLADFRQGSGCVYAVTDDEFAEIIDDLYLSQITDEPRLNWIWAFAGYNGHNAHTLGQIEYWRIRGACVQRVSA